MDLEHDSRIERGCRNGAEHQRGDVTSHAAGADGIAGGFSPANAIERRVN